MKQILISCKNAQKESLEIFNNSKKIGDFFSDDRFYTLTNCQIDEGLIKYSTILYIMTIFLFRSYNFKHSTSIVKGKPKWVTLIDVFCWLCLAIFIFTLITGIAQPIIEGITGAIKGNFDGFINSFKAAFGNPITITLFIVSAVAFIISMSYIYVMRKIVAVNKKLTLKDFVIQKLSFVNRFENMLRISDNLKKANKKIKKINKKISKNGLKIKPDIFYLIDNVESLSLTDRWLVFQISNIMYNLFPDSGILLKLNNLEDIDVEKLKTICNSDFKHIKITQIDNFI
ncbi:hypothetical protein [Mycoplasmoides alvi]|uniref:hypothetical protein n=1 Tax=Mycoplasmoides alvi TaxID=78580 RepID=UPI00051BE9ED|nr:hypothetical protein [Mycoplasmoides alvi]